MAFINRDQDITLRFCTIYQIISGSRCRAFLNMRGFMDVESFQSPHDTLTQQRIGTRLVHLEQN
ncbi:hypothetical protein EDF82_0529 [Raoultella sp. BIGb0399]|nr:hypothetical protein EDF82_0529 [Raoultella sp. BIGb0399]